MTDTTYEYAVRECELRASTREALLNEMATDRWEPIDLRSPGSFEWSSKDQITFRRPRI